MTRENNTDNELRAQQNLRMQGIAVVGMIGEFLLKNRAAIDATRDFYSGFRGGALEEKASPILGMLELADKWIAIHRGIMGYLEPVPGPGAVDGNDTVQ